ncbi:hypothetical protein [Rathayibacter tanaceti]|uniref:Uncharacterized protein n=2 Tax=Rathayibacter tanaceti TaxID=1671680 RepID=A0A166HSD0_9MICO|nr:hypothetical protein [Rathayibacter tanaceti]KZX21092.1 hypothetical protein ACH61_01794 [Rathayibacter tanaceti]QHC55705.1 hypothetical protein GSU10_08720 [Rathayibacter tanaceti]TCO39485.1 hypothetical protein EV639_101433 [Rathayibacter tanaceti]
MSETDPVEIYMDDVALGIYDESVRLRRGVLSSVLYYAAAVAPVTIFFGLFLWIRWLQRDLPAAEQMPDIVIHPANSSLLTGGFTALLAVIVAVWFTPVTFRVGASETPSTIARELASKRIVAVIARLCGLLSLSLAGWAFLSSVTTGPGRIDVLRMVMPVVLGVGLALWAAAAEMRIGEVQVDKLLWAEYRRKAERLRLVAAGEDDHALSSRARLLQQSVAFVAIPLALWMVGLVIAPPPNGSATIARFAAEFVVTAVAYVALGEITYRLVGGQVWRAVFGYIALMFVGAFFWLSLVGAIVTSDVSDGALPLGPVARSMLLFTVVVLSGPFVALSVFTMRGPFGRWRGVIFDSVMRRYYKDLGKVERQLSRASGEQTSVQAVPLGAPTAFAWAGLVALVPVVPFNLLFAGLALRLARDRTMRGRTIAIAAIVVGVVVTVLSIGFLVHIALSDPTLIACEADPMSPCFR